jgi:hypothetical protein
MPSGKYFIYIGNYGHRTRIYCDMAESAGGWTVSSTSLAKPFEPNLFLRQIPFLGSFKGFGGATVERSPLLPRIPGSTPGLRISEIYLSSSCSPSAQSGL